MNTINKAGIIGAGMMGAEIGLCFALNNIEVYLKDIDLKFAESGKKRIQGILSKWTEQGKMDSDKSAKALERIIPKDNFSGFEDADLVVEAAIEDIEIKRNVFKELDEVCKEGCIFATNTSSIPISQLAGYTSRPAFFIGMHFFSPASVMKLVEVIPGLGTSKETIGKIMSVARDIGKEPVMAPDRAGFIVNRLLFAFITEAWRIVNEGAATPEDIDKAVKLGLGHPIGIFQMQDFVGLDNTISVSNILFEEYGERFKPSPLLKRKVAANHLGKKVKKGWFDYNK
jgi:3-hydroxybutyryl-CoA dehydrogenase